MFVFCNRKNTSHKKLRKKICKFASELGIKGVTFNKNAKAVNGTYNPLTSQTFLSLALTKKEMLCTFFHEIAHHVAVKNNMWRNYHFGRKSFSEIERYDIENQIDQIANSLWHMYVSKKQWGKYVYSYPKRLRPKPKQ